MTEKAISLLQGNPKGFVLQVEGASIDKRDHAADVCGQIGETARHGRRDRRRPGVPAHHPGHADPRQRRSLAHEPDHPRQPTPRGVYTTLQTVDGQPIRIAYGTAPVNGSQAHTGATVPVIASGPRAADIVGTIDQTELFPVLTNTQTGDGSAAPSVTVPSDVGGAVPATLALTTGPAATFGAFQPGVGRDYTASLLANVISSAANAALTVADPSGTATGRLVNGTYALEQPLQAKAGAGAFSAIGGSAAPTALAAWTGPVSNDAVTLDFKQSIGAADPLRTGTYAKTLTLTLSTTAP